MRNNLAPALIGSALLHVAVFGFALWKFPNETREVLNAVPVQIVSDVPALAPAPPAPPTMEETPEPVPVEEPAPEPTPSPPEPPKPTPKPEPKVDPKATPKKDKAPPKKAEAAVDPLSFVKDLSKASSKPRSSQADRPTQGTSRTGAADADLGPAKAALAQKLNDLWYPNCGADGARDVVIKMRFAIMSSGELRGPPVWVNENLGNKVMVAAADRAKAAIGKGQPYDDLPKGLFNQDITVNFIGKLVCP